MPAVLPRPIIALVLLSTLACSGPGVDDDGSNPPGSDGNGAEVTPGDETGAGAGAETGPDVFCGPAAAFLADDSVTDVAVFSAEFFSDVDVRLARLVELAPAEIRADVEVLRVGFAETDTTFAEFEYDVSNADLGEALAGVDEVAMLDATDNIQRYLGQACGGSSGGGVDEGQVDAIVETFGVDRRMAECLNLELGDVANIESEELTPELLTRPVCGTTLFAIVSGGPIPG